MMKLEIINPDCGLIRSDLEKRQNYLQKVTDANTTLWMDSTQNNNIYIDSMTDAALATPEIVQIGIQAYKNGFDGIGIYCFSDPGVDALRELLPIPVIGAGMTSMSVSTLLGEKISLIITSSSLIKEKYLFLRRNGIDLNRISSIRGLDLESNDTKKITQKFVDVAKQCVNDGADVIVIACLAYNQYAEKIMNEIDVPVVNPGFSLVNTLELVVKQKISQSKTSYPQPVRKTRYWQGGSI
ncbi:aspartate/glutamate racemase family protein [Paucilactobacillus sp. N302-9]